MNEANKTSLLQHDIPNHPFGRLDELSLEMILEKLKIKLKYNKNDLEKKVEITDIIISNHPCSFDILFLASLLYREKVMFITQNKRVRALKRLFGDDRIYPFPVLKKDEKMFIEKVEKKQQSGVKLCLFPTGGTETKELDNEVLWLSFYHAILKKSSFRCKKVLPLRIDPVTTQELQARIGAERGGVEIFPELHYKIPTKPITVNIDVGGVFKIDNVINVEEEYNNSFN